MKESVKKEAPVLLARRYLKLVEWSGNPALHKKASLKALTRGESLNQFVASALAEA